MSFSVLHQIYGNNLEFHGSKTAVDIAFTGPAGIIDMEHYRSGLSGFISFFDLADLDTAAIRDLVEILCCPGCIILIACAPDIKVRVVVSSGLGIRKIPGLVIIAMHIELEHLILN